MQTKLKELFAYENVLFEGTTNAKVLVWNNRTMLIAEENSEILCGEALAFTDLMDLLINEDVGAVTVLLFAAMHNTADSINLDKFIDFINYNELEEYKAAVLDGINNYLPDSELEEELREISTALSDKEKYIDEPDHWTGLYYFCKKQLRMSDEEFLESTWRKIALLQREFANTLPEVQKIRPVYADDVDI